MRVVEKVESPRSPSPEGYPRHSEDVSERPWPVDNNIYSPTSSPPPPRANFSPQPGPSWWDEVRDGEFVGIDSFIRNYRRILEQSTSDEVYSGVLYSEIEVKEEFKSSQDNVCDEIIFIDLSEEDVANSAQIKEEEEEIDVLTVEEEEEEEEEEEIDVVGYGEENNEVEMAAVEQEEEEENHNAESGYGSSISDAETEEMIQDDILNDPDYCPESEMDFEEDPHLFMEQESRMRRVSGLRKNYWRARISLVRLERQQDMAKIRSKINEMSAQRRRRERDMTTEERRMMKRIDRNSRDHPIRRVDLCAKCGKIFWSEKLRRWIRCEECGVWICPDCGEEGGHCEM